MFGGSGLVSVTRPLHVYREAYSFFPRFDSGSLGRHKGASLPAIRRSFFRNR